MAVLPVTKKKRLRKEKLRATRSQAVPESSVLEVPIPDPGPRTLGAGWGVSWRGFLGQLRRPFSLLPVTLGTMIVFFMIQAALLYGMNLVLYGAQIPTGPQAQRINTGLWQIFTYLLGPASMAPWFAARTLFANRLPASWKLVKEPFGAPWRWAHLLGVGVVWVLFAGSVGAAMAQWGEALSLGAALGTVAVLWLVTQVVFSVAAAAVWRDALPWYRALGRAVMCACRGIVPLSGVVLAWLTQVLVVGGLLFVTFGMPLALIEMSFEQFSVLTLILLPAILLVFSFSYHQRAILSLALLDWGNKDWRKTHLPASPPPSEPEAGASSA